MLRDFLTYRVSDFMSTRGVVIAPTCRLEEAERLFETHDFNLFPVVERGRLIGVLTKLDFLKAFRFQPDHVIPPYHEILGQAVTAVMTREPHVVAPDIPLTKVIERMVDTHHRSFPVVEAGRLLGIISRGDVVRALGRASGARHSGAA